MIKFHLGWRHAHPHPQHWAFVFFRQSRLDKWFNQQLLSIIWQNVLFVTDFQNDSLKHFLIGTISFICAFSNHSCKYVLWCDNAMVKVWLGLGTVSRKQDTNNWLPTTPTSSPQYVDLIILWHRHTKLPAWLYGQQSPYSHQKAPLLERKHC